MKTLLAVLLAAWSTSAVAQTPTATPPPPSAVQQASSDTPPVVERATPPAECRRQIGGSVGMVFPTNAWDLLGSGPLLTGSPTVSLVCTLPGRIRGFAGLTTAPLQAHWYRELGRAGLFVLPSFGIATGNKPFRFGAYIVAMPRLIGAGMSLEFRFAGSEGSWLTHTGKGESKGFEARFQVLDGDLIQYQLSLRYTFGVTVL